MLQKMLQKMIGILEDHLGIFLEILFCGIMIECEKNGQIKDKITDAAEMSMLVERNDLIIGYEYDDGSSGNLKFERIKPDKAGILIHKIKAVLHRRQQLSYFQAPLNKLVIIRPQRAGKFEIWEVSLPCQNFKPFLRVEKVYEGQLTKIAGRRITILDPHFTQFKHLLPTLEEEWKKKRRKMPLQYIEPVDFEQLSTQEPQHPFSAHELLTLRTGHYRVFGWTESSGYGFAVNRKSQVVRIHHNHANGFGFDDFVYFKTGDIIEVDHIDEGIHTSGPLQGKERLEATLYHLVWGVDGCHDIRADQYQGHHCNGHCGCGKKDKKKSAA